MTFTRVTQAVLLYALLGVITSLPVRYLNCVGLLGLTPHMNQNVFTN